MQKHAHGVDRHKDSGFTLIELIIVLLVLASLAALVVPTLGFVKDQADTSLAANGAQQVLNNLETFKAATGRYPNRMDSLLDEDGDFYAPVYAPFGAPYIGEIADYDTDEEIFFYYMRNGGGVSEVVVHDSNNVPGADGFDPNKGGTTVTLGGDTKLNVVLAGTSYTGKKGQILATCFPNQAPADVAAGRATVPDGHTLVLLGVGATNGAVGATMTQAPLSPEKSGYDKDNYDRFIAVFDCTTGGPNFRGQMKLKAVLDPEFNVVSRNITAYKSSTPDDGYGSSP